MSAVWILLLHAATSHKTRTKCDSCSPAHTTLFDGMHTGSSLNRRPVIKVPLEERESKPWKADKCKMEKLLRHPTSAAETNESVEATLRASRRLHSSVLSITVMSVSLSGRGKGGIKTFSAFSLPNLQMVTRHNHPMSRFRFTLETGTKIIVQGLQVGYKMLNISFKASEFYAITAPH